MKQPETPGVTRSNNPTRIKLRTPSDMSHEVTPRSYGYGSGSFGLQSGFRFPVTPDIDGMV